MKGRMSKAEAAQRLLGLAVALGNSGAGGGETQQAILMGAKVLIKRVAERERWHERRRGEADLEVLEALRDIEENAMDVREVAGELVQIAKSFLEGKAFEGYAYFAGKLARCAERLDKAVGVPKKERGGTESALQNGDKKGGAE